MTDSNQTRASPKLKFTKEELELKKSEKAALKNSGIDTGIKGKQKKKSQEKFFRRYNAEPASGDRKAGVSKSETTVRTEETKSIPVSDSRFSVHNTRPKISEELTQPAKQKGTQSQKSVNLSFENPQKKSKSRMIHPVEKTIRLAGDQLHRQAVQSNEDDNAGVQAALTAEQSSRAVLHEGEHMYHAYKLRKTDKLENSKLSAKQNGLHTPPAKQTTSDPKFTSNPISRWQQKRAIREEYAAAKAGRNTSKAEQSYKSAKTAARTTVDTIKTAIVKMNHSPRTLLILGIIGVLLVVMGALQSCTPLAQSVLESLVIGTYPAEEDDIRAAERAYAEKERQLKEEIQHYAKYHPGYDEYHIDADDIWHDPYVLIAIISAYYDGQEWDLDAAYPVIGKYFKLQYELTETIITETRYTTEHRSGTHQVWDDESGAYYTEPYEYDEQVPYDYTICNVKLENKKLSHLPVISMSRHGLGMYALYMASHGNMDGIFRGGYAVMLRDPYIYDIPQETLDADPKFAKLMEEANKYIGYPYVWGGKSPETSFDCTGFVSYVFANSGVYESGQLGEGGITGLCRPVTEEELKPGDVVFFKGTLGEDVSGTTHCGIYVGNRYMIHCGSPIGYVSLDDAYYKEHFESYGRMPGF